LMWILRLKEQTLDHKPVPSYLREFIIHTKEAHMLPVTR
jgi:hypothetical protein